MWSFLTTGNVRKTCLDLWAPVKTLWRPIYVKQAASHPPAHVPIQTKWVQTGLKCNARTFVTRVPRVNGYGICSGPFPPLARRWSSPCTQAPPPTSWHSGIRSCPKQSKRTAPYLFWSLLFSAHHCFLLYFIFYFFQLAAQLCNPRKRDGLFFWKMKRFQRDPSKSQQAIHVRFRHCQFYDVLCV